MCADCSICCGSTDSFSSLNQQTTSNRAPKELYKHGIQRETFLPFIGDLAVHCDVFHIQSELDYREKMMIDEFNRTRSESDWIRCFFTPVTPETSRIFEGYYSEISGNKPQKTLELEVNQGRCIKLPGVGNISRIDFEILMENQWGPNEFRAVFDHVRFLFLENVRPIDVTSRNECARFTMMAS